MGILSLLKLSREQHLKLWILNLKYPCSGVPVVQVGSTQSLTTYSDCERYVSAQFGGGLTNAFKCVYQKTGSKLAQPTLKAKLEESADFYFTHYHGSTSSLKIRICLPFLKQNKTTAKTSQLTISRKKNIIHSLYSDCIQSLFPIL